jgi:hypothetical protein
MGRARHGEVEGVRVTDTTLTIAIPGVHNLAELQREAEENAPAYALVTIEDANDYTLADALLTDVAQRKADVLAMRKSATGPMYTAAKTVEAWFRPLLTALEASEAALKRVMGQYRIALEKREREARELAAKAAEASDAKALVTALTVASEAATKPAGRATARYVWAVESCNPPAMSREFLVPDVSRLEALARAHKGDEPPIVPGVVFVRRAIIGARK